MLIYAIRRDDVQRPKNLGYVFCDNGRGICYIELEKKTQPMRLPMICESFAKRGKVVVPQNVAMLFVRERTPDERRQNLDMMLEEYGMGEYDPFVLLQYTQGRCPQDGFFLKKISEKKISEEVRQRREKRMLTATASPDGKVLITQAGGGVIVVEKSLFCEYTAGCGDGSVGSCPTACGSCYHSRRVGAVFGSSLSLGEDGGRGSAHYR